MSHDRFPAPFEGHRLSEPEEALYRLLIPPMEGRAINPQDFSDLYSPEMINTDLARVDQIEQGFNKSLSGESKAGPLFEALVFDQIEDSNWLGENATIIIPARFDDYVNGVDGIVEFDTDAAPSHLALAVDITRNEKRVEEKFKAIRTSIDHDQLSEVKYFRSENFKGRLSNVPRIVIGSDRAMIVDAIDLALRFKRMQKNAGSEFRGDFKSVRTALEEHPIQFQILLEAQVQIESFLRYAERQNKQKSAQSYRRILGVINDILSKKSEHPEAAAILDRAKRDSVFELIIEKARRFG
jgi:hypothetical protein